MFEDKKMGEKPHMGLHGRRDALDLMHVEALRARKAREAQPDMDSSFQDLTIEEAALLAAILPSPRRYDPIRHTAYLTRRQRHIVRWLERGNGRKAASINRLPPESLEVVPVE